MYRETLEAPIGEVVQPEVSPKSPTLDGFIAWLEQKPADEEFLWASCHACAMGQWWTSTGLSKTGNPYAEASFALGGQATMAVLKSIVLRSPCRGTFGHTLASMKDYRASLDGGK